MTTARPFSPQRRPRRSRDALALPRLTRTTSGNVRERRRAAHLEHTPFLVLALGAADDALVEEERHGLRPLRAGARPGCRGGPARFPSRPDGRGAPSRRTKIFRGALGEGQEPDVARPLPLRAQEPRGPSAPGAPGGRRSTAEPADAGRLIVSCTTVPSSPLIRKSGARTRPCRPGRRQSARSRRRGGFPRPAPGPRRAEVTTSPSLEGPTVSPTPE